VLATTAAAIAALLPVLGPGLDRAAAAVARAAVADPLVVHIDEITRVLPESGNVDITGTVRNASTEQYTRVNLLAISSASPITDPITLAASAATAADEYVGQRVTVPGTFDTVDVLDPGQTESFSLSVPVELLDATGEPGVYWIGVQALGDSTTIPRDDIADGRARTFIPALPEDNPGLESAVILPLRSRVWFQPDGSVAGSDRWQRWLSDGGRLDTVLDIADSASANAYTWLVDPAILYAVRQLAAGNPPRSLAPDPTVPGQEPTEPTPEEEDGGTQSPTPTTDGLTPPADGTEEQPTEQEAALATAAAAWLERYRTATIGRPVLALPFGDIDVSAAVRHRPERYQQARERGLQVMAELGIAARAAVAPLNDVLSREAMLATPADTTVLLGDTAFAAPPQTANSTVRLLGHKVVVTSTGAASGGPAPTRADDPLAIRQRLLSEAALRVADGSTAPVVVAMPSGWSPEDATALFSAFEEPWLTSVGVPEIEQRSAAGIPSLALKYTEEDMAGELDPANFLAADRLIQSSSVLEEVLALQTTVERQVRDEALVTLSQQHRDKPRVAQRSCARLREHIVDQLASIRVEAPRGVTLSSDTGQLGATLVNGLDQPVNVNVVATSDGEMTLTGPDLRRLAPGSRSLIRFQATAERPGVHNVRLAVTSESGTALGSSARLPIRATSVSGLIWVVMAAGGALLLGPVGLRLWRQVRGQRGTS
jgi:hypothetical protein